MYAQRPALALCQYVKVSAGLCGFYYAKGIFLSGYRQISGIVTGDLQEDAGVGAAFICLPGGVQEARTKTQASGYSFAIANRVAYRLQAVFVLAVHLHVGQQSQIISCSKLVQMGAQQARQGIVVSGKLLQVGGVAVIGKQLYAIFFKNRFLFGELSVLLVCGDRQK